MAHYYRGNRSVSPVRSDKSYRIALTPSMPPLVRSRPRKTNPMVEYFKNIDSDDRSNLESIKNVLEDGERINLLDVWCKKVPCPVKGQKIIAGMEIEIQSSRKVYQLFSPRWFWSALLAEGSEDQIDLDKLAKDKSTSWLYLGFKMVGKKPKHTLFIYLSLII